MLTLMPEGIQATGVHLRFNPTGIWRVYSVLFYRAQPSAHLKKRMRKTVPGVAYARGTVGDSARKSLPTRPIFASVPSCLLAVYKHQIVVANQNKKKVQSNSCVAVFWLLSCLCIQCVFVFCPNQTTLLRLYLLWILNWLLTGPHLC